MLSMDDAIRKQTCTRLLKPNSIFDLNQSNYKMQVACMNLIENKHAFKLSNSIPKSIKLWEQMILHSTQEWNSIETNMPPNYRT